MEQSLYLLLRNTVSNLSIVQQAHSLLLTTGIFSRSMLHFNTLLRSYSLSEAPHRAFSVYSQLQSLYFFNSSYLQQPPSFDSFSYTFLINAATYTSSLAVGTQFQCLGIKAGFQSHVYVQTSLVNMYAAAGFLSDALLLFDEMPERNAVTWNAMITGLVKLGEIEFARSLFDEMLDKNVVTWTCMIDGYVRMIRFGEGFALFRRMACFEDMIKPSEITILAILPAVSSLKELDLCRLIHCYSEKRGFHAFDIRVANSIVDTYSKCGCIASASKFFDDMERKNLVSWTSIITGLAMHGLGNEAVDCFTRMEQAGWKPNRVTFLSLFNACSHGGLYEQGLKFFDQMVSKHRVSPDIKHYGCLVDMLARIGRLEEAERLAMGVPSEIANVVIWRTLLGACSFHGDVEMAERVTRKIMEMEKGYGGDYVLMHNIFVGSGRFCDAERVRRLMHQRNAFKLPGQSLI
ncbi:Pentatricopeptide repeat-containing protein At1g09220, mitochondrial [Linum grandiflorum]